MKKAFPDGQREHVESGGKGLDTLGASGWFIVCGSCGSGVRSPHPCAYINTHQS